MSTDYAGRVPAGTQRRLSILPRRWAQIEWKFEPNSFEYICAAPMALKNSMLWQNVDKSNGQVKSSNNL